MCVFFYLSPSVQGHTGFLQVALFGFSSNLTSLGEFVGFAWSLDTMRAQDEHRGFFGFGFFIVEVLVSAPVKVASKISVRILVSINIESLQLFTFH